MQYVEDCKAAGMPQLHVIDFTHKQGQLHHSDGMRLLTTCTARKCGQAQLCTIAQRLHGGLQVCVFIVLACICHFVQQNNQTTANSVQPLGVSADCQSPSNAADSVCLGHKRTPQQAKLQVHDHAYCAVEVRHGMGCCDSSCGCRFDHSVPQVSMVTSGEHTTRSSPRLQGLSSAKTCTCCITT